MYHDRERSASFRNDLVPMRCGSVGCSWGTVVARDEDDTVGLGAGRTLAIDLIRSTESSQVYMSGLTLAIPIGDDDSEAAAILNGPL